MTADFIDRHRSDAAFGVIYVAEAHFVERNPETKEVINGWPLGFPAEYERPSHRTLEDRLEMARFSIDALLTLQKADFIAVDNMTDSFADYYGAWPEQILCLDTHSGELLFKGMHDYEKNPKHLITQLESVWSGL